MQRVERRDFWFTVVRAAWFATAGLATLILIASVPAYLAQLGTLTQPEQVQRAVAGLPATTDSLEYWLDFANMILQLAAAAACLALAAVIVRRRSHDPMAIVLSFFLPVFGVVIAGPLQTLAQPRADWFPVVGALEAILFAGWAVLFYLFPDGHFTPRWTPWLALAFGPWTLLSLVFRSFLIPMSKPEPVQVVILFAWYMIWPVTSLAAQVYRYRRVSNQVQRQQTKWVMFGFAVLVGVMFGIPALIALLLFNRPDQNLAFLMSVRSFDLIWSFLVSLVPLSMGIAILRYHLFDIDVLINRTLVYGGLTAIIVGIYVLIVGSLSELLHEGSNFLISLLATGLIAILFQPLRERLQRAANRLMYGERDDPYAVLSRLGQRLEATLAPEAVLPTLVETIAQTLKLPYVAIALQRANGSEPEIAAAYGLPIGAVVRLPLTYQSGHVGELLIAPRAPDETFTPAEQRLLADIAHQAGVAAHAVRLTADLQRSRERLVTAREEERRRLRRDLHDGLGPALAIHSLKVGSARSLLTRSLPVLSGLESVEQDVATADAVLAELERDIATALTDIRRLVYDLRPPTLDELGLVAAVRESAARYAPTAAPNANALRITVDAPERLPLLPAAVEVAAFRITQEGLTNVVRHAQARTCRICLKLEDGLWVEISDDGVGLSAARTEHPAGVGLASMRERAEELGGTCVIESPPAGGTRVLARLPLG